MSDKTIPSGVSFLITSGYEQIADFTLMFNLQSRFQTLFPSHVSGIAISDSLSMVAIAIEK
jgi:hypothetical protein